MTDAFLPFPDHTALRIEVNGIVQGVGFRPFVYQLAQQYGLTGEVANTAFGVAIHAEGTSGHISDFVKDIPTQAPPLARITKIETFPADKKNLTDFSILPSRSGPSLTTLIPPDISVCPDCLKELQDPKDRRYGYPFINCTNCGPRYTIIDNVPYDRASTTMKTFAMCPACRAEYDDPANRRFHAQPNACADCGPSVILYDGKGDPIASTDPLGRAAEVLEQGDILAVKGIGGFHLAVDAANDQAVNRLRKRKRREEKPFALMARDMAAIRRFAVPDVGEESLLTSPQKPVVLVLKKETNGIAGGVAPHNNYFGVMLPYSPLHDLLLDKGVDVLVMTSGNVSEEPIVTDNNDAFTRLFDIADYFLVHNRDIKWGCDDSIVRNFMGREYPLRRSRGYVPVPVGLKQDVPQILACGGEMKNTICLTKGQNAFLSQHLGDLENLAAFDVYRATIQQLRHLLDITPEIIACDMHPDYFSTQYAKEQKEIKVVAVQHHHAHIAGVMAEHHLDGPVLGLAFDGTGWGPDHTLWGGEVLMVDKSGYKRVGHLEPLPMPGANAAINEPWRMAVSYLYHTFGKDLLHLKLPLLDHIPGEALNITLQMIRQKINSPLTSSLGRLFDGVAALCNICRQSRYEGQAAMRVEMTAGGDTKQTYAYEWEKTDSYIIRLAPLVQDIVSDLLYGTPEPVVCKKFHNTLIRLFVSLCKTVRNDTGINEVALSGGVFQNVMLLEGMVRGLEDEAFTVYIHRQVPTNDGGISLGQAWVAANACR